MGIYINGDVTSNDGSGSSGIKLNGDLISKADAGIEIGGSITASTYGVYVEEAIRPGTIYIGDIDDVAGFTI